MTTLREILIVLLAAALLITAPAAANAIVNGDFETGSIVGWVNDYGNVTVQSGQTYSGGNAANMTSVADGDIVRLYQEEIDFDEAADNLTFALKITGSSVYPLFRVLAMPNEGEWDFYYSRSTKTTGWEIIEINTSAWAGNYTVLIDCESQDQNLTIAYLDSITTDARVPVASFSQNQTNGTSPLRVQFTDTSINVPTGWGWNATNIDNSTTIQFSTSQNPAQLFDPGNWSISLLASNADGQDFSDTSWVNVTASSSGTTTFIIIVLNYIHQILGYLPAHLLTGGYHP